MIFTFQDFPKSGTSRDKSSTFQEMWEPWLKLCFAKMSINEGCNVTNSYTLLQIQWLTAVITSYLKSYSFRQKCRLKRVDHFITTWSEFPALRGIPSLHGNDHVTWNPAGFPHGKTQHHWRWAADVKPCHQCGNLHNHHTLGRWFPAVEAMTTHLLVSQISPAKPVSYTHLTLPTNREV